MIRVTITNEPDSHHDKELVVTTKIGDMHSLLVVKHGETCDRMLIDGVIIELSERETVRH